MTKMLLLSALAFAACVPPQSTQDDCEYYGDCYDEYGPSEPGPSPFELAMSRVLADRATGFASLRTGDGVQVADGAQGWLQESAPIPVFHDKSCTVARYDDRLARVSNYVLMCGATVTLADEASLVGQMTSQIGGRVPSDWKRDHAQAGETETWSWAPPNEEPAVYIRVEPFGADRKAVSLLIWSRNQPLPAALVGLR